MAHVAWRGDITLMLSGCRQCWVYKVLAFAHREGYMKVILINSIPMINVLMERGKKTRGALWALGLVMDKLNELYRRNIWENIQGINTYMS